MADTTNTTTIHTVEVVRYDDPVIITERVAVSAFIAGYTNPTSELRDRSADLRRLVPRQWRQLVERQATTPRDICTMDGTRRVRCRRRLSTSSSFYKYCQIEDVLDRNPAVNVRRPQVHDESW